MLYQRFYCTSQYVVVHVITSSSLTSVHLWSFQGCQSLTEVSSPHSQSTVYSPAAPSASYRVGGGGGGGGGGEGGILMPVLGHNAG